mmetsp:Transcript_11713/g.23582  ORF Transcript_11713/g.23582 Transcript_11713/m.23582 type:complete len:203 (+) Transcript_11713:103-711(+)
MCDSVTDGAKGTPIAMCACCPPQVRVMCPLCACARQHWALARDYIIACSLLNHCPIKHRICMLPFKAKVTIQGQSTYCLLQGRVQGVLICIFLSSVIHGRHELARGYGAPLHTIYPSIHPSILSRATGPLCQQSIEGVLHVAPFRVQSGTYFPLVLKPHPPQHLRSSREVHALTRPHIGIGTDISIAPDFVLPIPITTVLTG